MLVVRVAEIHPRLNMSNIILTGAVCSVAGSAKTTVGACAVATDCCGTYAALIAGTPVIANKMLCFPAGNKKLVSYTATAADNLTDLTSNAAFAIADCAAAPAGASTLAVSAAALATAVYMM
jgi:hypothetical protein